MGEKLHSTVNNKPGLDSGEALNLLLKAELLDLGKRADSMRRRMHPDRRVGFVVDRNVNYTNVCESKCRFCAFYRDSDAPDAYVLDKQTIYRKIEDLVRHDGTQLLMQGGLHPRLDIEWFEDLFRVIKSRYPDIRIHSLSPAEVFHIGEISGLSMPECLSRLHEAGLDSLPGGGAEILVDSVREDVSPNKIGWQDWAAVMEEAHRLGMPTTATMMFGSRERPEDIVEHLFRIREIQARTGGFTAFIPWTFQPDNTDLGGETASGVEYLKVLALSRLVLDNIENIQSSWVTQGAEMAQIALFFGANDLGGTMLEENVVAAAGVSFRMNKEQIIELIRSAGFIPVRRTTTYETIEVYDS